jgi:tripartite-type tricarboxylate transporter receptor subunit TctC
MPFVPVCDHRVFPLLTRYGVLFVAALLFCFLAPTVVAQSYPAKPLRIIVRAPPGGTDDLLARLITAQMSKVTGQRVSVDYRPGAGGLVAWEYVAKQPPDGYTLLLAASGLAAIRSLRPDMPVDPWRDFTWISLISNFMLVLTVHPSLPAKNARELIALARSRPGQLSYGSSGVGATPHLAAEYFKAMAKIDIRHIPYKGAGPMYIDLMAGRIEVGTAVLGGAIPHIQAGKMRAIGVSGANRSPQVPEIPTLAEGGLPGYEFTAFYTLLLPGGAPRDIVAALADVVARTASAPEFREQVLKNGLEPAHNTPEQMLQLAKRDADKIDRIVRAAGIKAE